MVQPAIQLTDVFHEFFFLIECFLCAGAYQHDGRNCCDDIQVTEHIFLLVLVTELTSVKSICHQFVDSDLLINSLDHNLLVYRLIITANKVTIKIHIQIIHVLNIWKRLKCKQVVYIKRMLRKLQSTFVEQFSTVDHGMHEEIFSLRHTHLVPLKDFIYRETVSVLHDLFPCCTLFLIYEIADQKVNSLWSADEFFQSFEDLLIRFCIYPVITVHNLEIKSACISDSCIDCFAVAAVFLVDCLDDRRIFLCISICNLCCAVG